jgi:hypothetical protein
MYINIHDKYIYVYCIYNIIRGRHVTGKNVTMLHIIAYVFFL